MPVVWAVLLAVGGGVASMTRADGTPQAAPRIEVRQGRFVAAETGEAFEPRGFNYIRLGPDHATFAPGLYDASRVQAMLEDLHKRGFNTVRVFIDFHAGSGIVASPRAEGLSADYVANFVDFVRRAQAQRVYVVASLLSLPQGRHYHPAGDRPVGQSAGVNRLYTETPLVAAKAEYLRRFVTSIRDREASLLPSILAYELDNETWLDAKSPPFSLRTGTFLGDDGQTYDLASDVELQRLADDLVVRWADACVGAVRSVDEQAMVSANVFTFAAVGRSGPGALLREAVPDRRFPARPLALTRTTLSYLDIHFYPVSAHTLDDDLASIEFDDLTAECRRRGLPLMMGEFGAFKSRYPSLSQAVWAMREYRDRMSVLGFSGYLYWTYDSDEQPALWNACSGGGQILRALANQP